MNNNIVKVVYFDENSAMDYINILDGGQVESESVVSSEAQTNGKLSIGAKIMSKLSFLNSFSAEASVNSGIELINQSKDIVKSTITNTILTDFISKVESSDSMVSNFKNINIQALKNSFTYLKLYTPYTNIISENSDVNKDVSVNKLDEFMEKIKGYYEVLGKKTLESGEEKQYILRFNISCFRNNYKLTDLFKMNLTYYGIKVGNTSLENLDINKEMNFGESNSEITAEKIVNELMNKGDVVGDTDEIEIYDIVLAGVSYNGNV